MSARLRHSLAQQVTLLHSSLILNPVENFPFADDISVLSGPLHGLYNSDKLRSRAQRLETPIQFAGRQGQESDSRAIYEAWADALGASDATLRLLSGLHAHIILFMALARPGDNVLLLPVTAGGHMATKAILERLGLNVVEMIVDESSMTVDMGATLNLASAQSFKYVFVDRSEGLVYEDFTPLANIAGATTIFDASQYLTNIISGDYANPFERGFDLVVASLHKNFPGPQQALIATNESNEVWRTLIGGISIYVSNMHTTSIYAAGLTLDRREWLAAYSQRIMSMAVALEEALLELGVPAVQRPDTAPPTHHLWIREASKELAFRTYEDLETCRILTNFRSLPYSLGYGLRLGVSAAVRIGLSSEDIPVLADLIADIRRRGPTALLRGRAKEFNQELWSRV